MNSSFLILLNLTFLIASVKTCGTIPGQKGTTETKPDSSRLEQKQDSVGSTMQTGAEQTNLYLKILKNKRVGMVVNPTSMIGKQTSVDSLLKAGVQIARIFGPEHGFRGNASAGASVSDAVDAKTGIKAVSLYGKHEKPTAADLADIDIVVFDIQDVGVRFYTYINTLQYVMEACAENNKELLILDRPNPNGFNVDGPVLDPKLVSGVGLQAIPIVHGLTVAEYAQMLNGEGWLKNKVKCKLNIIKVANYNHDMPYDLPVKPSPNLNTQQSILLYPSLCLFEGTILSQGRGTQFPFTVLGAPALKGKYKFSFTPMRIPGMAETPLHQDMACYGLDLRDYSTETIRKQKELNIKWLMELYRAYPNKADFFNNKLSKQMGNFDKLAGVGSLKEQIIAGKSEREIRASWEPALTAYKTMRTKYLLYP